MSTEVHTSARTVPLLTPDEVAAVLRISKRHVRRLALAGRLERIELGARTVRYAASSIEALISPTNNEARADNADPVTNADPTGEHGQSYDD